MSTRRGFLATVTAFVGGVAVPNIASAKTLSNDVGITVVLSLDDSCGPNTDLKKIAEKAQQAFGCRVVVLPPGITIKTVVHAGMVSQSETLGNYSYEVVARTETELRERLKSIPQ